MKLYGDPISTTCRPVMLLAAESGIDLKVEHIDLFTGAHMKPDTMATLGLLGYSVSFCELFRRLL